MINLNRIKAMHIPGLAAAFLVLSASLSTFSSAQENIPAGEPQEANTESSMDSEDKAYTSYAICAGYYSVMVDEFRALPTAPEVDNTIAAYEEAGEVSTLLATTFAAIDYSAEAIDAVVEGAINRETENFRDMISHDVQLVGSLYDMICERMIDEGVTVLAG
ncbi:MAG: hypothetical protein CMP91_09690 [Gammaproteobacteria bacterium]|nr:hypothetical protein [Gammaproteobacteria bacterium]MAY03693.1 hypothetical protein [Gammaproteobacteria bacterium]|tara:strand:- start:293 stop:778 length:486 start_codon:yes stop_codon:yes gene_type:complete